MADAMSNYAENLVLDALLGGSLKPSVYVAVFDTTGSLANLESGVLTGEPVGGNYARTAVTFGAAVGGVKSNNAMVQFPQATSAWGTLRYMALMDAASGGNVLVYGQMVYDKAVDINDILIFDIGQISCTLT